MPVAQLTAVATAVDATNFITASNASAEAFKTANLLKLLSVNALISGEKATGKLLLARYILPNASVIDASHYEELLLAIQSHSELIITHIEHISNLFTLHEHMVKKGIRVVATASEHYRHEKLDEIFSVRLYLPPLSERKEDVIELQKQYLSEAAELFGENNKLDMSGIEPDLSQNSASLRRQLFFYYLLSNITEVELMTIMEKFLQDKLGSNNDYRSFLHLYEAPLIRAGLKRFKSQLQLAEQLGLNRNTLRKKIAENMEYKLDE